MALFKNSTIKRTTKRVFSELSSAVVKFVKENPSKSFNEALQDHSFLQTVPIRGLTGNIENNASIFYDFIQSLPKNQKSDNSILTYHIVWSIVSYELKYDNSIGTIDDKKLVANIIENLAIKGLA